jgi:acetyl esterase/lipase
VGVAAGAAHSAGGVLIAATAKSARIKAMQIPALPVVVVPSQSPPLRVVQAFNPSFSPLRNPRILQEQNGQQQQIFDEIGRTTMKKSCRFSVFFISIAADVDHSHST